MANYENTTYNDYETNQSEFGSRDAPRNRSKANYSQHYRKKIKSEDIATFCWQLNIMIEGGVSVADAMGIISEDIDNLHLRDIVQQITQEMKSGESLSDCIAKYPRIFNPIFRAMIMAGETGGSLPMALQRLAKYYEGRDKLIRKIKGALSYPIFISVFVTLIVVAVMVFVIPRFQVIFKQMKGEMPAFTRAFMGIYDVIMHNALYGLMLIIFIVVIFSMYYKSKKGQEQLSKMFLSTPFIGKLISQSFFSMFCKTMSTLLSSGVSVVQALDILKNMTKNEQIKSSVLQVKGRIVEGSNIATAMSDTGFFPSVVSKMVQVGEESGSLPAVLDKTGDYYEKKVDTAITALMGILEPIMIVIVGSVVLVIVLALYLPVFSMS